MIIFVSGSSAWLDSLAVTIPCCLAQAANRVDRDVERVVVFSSAMKLKTRTTARCAEADASRGMVIVLLVFFLPDVDYLGVFKRRFKEEAGELLLCDFNFQLGRLLDVRGLLHFIFFMAGKRALHYGGYPVVLFDVVAAADGIFVPEAPWNKMFGDCFS